jgi:fido (protein-threonine AMPylation protein)
VSEQFDLSTDSSTVPPADQSSRRAGRPARDEVYLRLDLQIEELWNRMGGLPDPLEASDIWRGIWYEEAHHSTAIEGNSLIRNQVEQLLAEGRAVGNKQLREYMEVKGYADAAGWVYNQAIAPHAWHDGEIITIGEIREIHRKAMVPVWEVDPPPDLTDRESPGNFREHEIETFTGGLQPPSWVQVPADIDSWLAMVNALEARAENFPDYLAALHCRFEQIHPFLDGNGRVGRLILNLVLVRLGYPPAIIYKRQRTEYLRALRRADRREFGLLGELLARAILDNLYRFVIPAVAGPARLVPLSALASSTINADALRTAAARGRLQATRGPDGEWRSSQKWVNDYLDSRYRRGA